MGGALASFLKIRASRKQSPEVVNDAALARADPAEWVLFGNVYDLTPFMRVHPGGALVIKQLQGTDCTANFVSAHTLRVPTLKAIEKYRLRPAASHEMDVSTRFNWAHTPKHDAMRAELRALFKGRSTKAPAWALVWYATWVLVLLLSTWKWFTNGSLAAGMLMGVAMWSAALDIVHNGSHMNIFESPAANTVAATILGFWAWNTASWSRQHNLHHSTTNHEEDPDLHHFHIFGDYLAPFWGLAAGGWRLAESTRMKSLHQVDVSVHILHDDHEQRAVLPRACDAPHHRSRPTQQESLLFSHLGVRNRVDADRNCVHRPEHCYGFAWFAHWAAAYDDFKRAVLHLHANFACE